MKKIRLRVPASTSNIGPGFDTLGLALSCYNYIECEEISEGFHIEYKGESADTLNAASFKKTLPYQVFTETLKVLQYKPAGIKLLLENAIPLGKGLGSSGAVCIMCIAGAFLLAGHALSADDILALALRFEKHPDNITASLMGGFTVSTVTDRGIIYLKIPVSFSFDVVAVIPELELSTQQSRQLLASHISFEDARFNLNRVALLVAGMATGDTSVLREAVKDRLHQTYRSELLPGLFDVFEEGYSTGALACFLSGAGSSVIALAKENAELIGNRMATLWEQRLGVPVRYQVFQVDNTGLQILD